MTDKTVSRAIERGFDFLFANRLFCRNEPRLWKKRGDVAQEMRRRCGTSETTPNEQKQRRKWRLFPISAELLFLLAWRFYWVTSNDVCSDADESGPTQTSKIEGSITQLRVAALQ
jgi:hypothetical protein